MITDSELRLHADSIGWRSREFFIQCPQCGEGTWSSGLPAALSCLHRAPRRWRRDDAVWRQTFEVDRCFAMMSHTCPATFVRNAKVTRWCCWLLLLVTRTAFISCPYLGFLLCIVFFTAQWPWNVAIKCWQSPSSTFLDYVTVLWMASCLFAASNAVYLEVDICTEQNWKACTRMLSIETLLVCFLFCFLNFWLDRCLLSLQPNPSHPKWSRCACTRKTLRSLKWLDEEPLER